MTGQDIQSSDEDLLSIKGMNNDCDSISPSLSSRLIGEDLHKIEQFERNYFSRGDIFANFMKRTERKLKNFVTVRERAATGDAARAVRQREGDGDTQSRCRAGVGARQVHVFL